MTEKEGEMIHKEIANGLWKVFKEFEGIKQDDKEWMRCITALDAAVKDACGTEYERFARDMYRAFVNELARLSKL